MSVYPARPHRQHNNFKTTFKDTFFLELSTRLAGEDVMRYVNPRYLLTYLLYNILNSNVIIILGVGTMK